MRYNSTSERETARLAETLAAKLRPGDAVCLQGPLGAGKSVFARSLIRAICRDPGLEAPSPTFTLVQTYETPSGLLWHFDLYRIRSAEDIYELGWEEARAGGIAVVEWPERLDRLAPADRLDIVFSIPAPDERVLTFTPRGGWEDRNMR